MPIQSFTDLEAWKEAHQLLLGIYKATKEFPKSEDFGLISQIRRAAVSIESNIAEGFRRYSYKERAKFYYDARGSDAEVQTQLIISKDLGYISGEDFKNLWEKSEKTDKILNGLVRATRERSHS